MTPAPTTPAAGSSSFFPPIPSYSAGILGSLFKVNHMDDREVMAYKLQCERNARRQAEELLQKIGTELLERNEQMRRYAAELAEQMAETQTILDTAAEGILTLSEEGTIYRVNRAAESILNCVAQQIVGRSLSHYFPELFLTDDQGKTRLRLECLSSSQVPFLQVEGRTHTGRIFPAEIALSSWSRAHKPMYTAILRDRTSRQAMESRLALSQKLESVGRLAAGIAHELNSPIQYVMHNLRFVQEALLGLEKLHEAYEEVVRSEDLERRPVAQEQLHRTKQEIDFDYLREEIPAALSQSVEGTNRVVQIVQAMREFSHPGQRSREWCDVNRVVQNVALIARNEYKNTAQLILDLDPDVPQIHGFPPDLGQAVINLLVNAVDAVEERRAREPLHSGWIRICTRGADQEVILRVEDNGSGIPVHHLGRIFDPFFTTKMVGKGTGQGLAICRSVIVDKHCGSLDVESHPDCGTTFEIRLPREVSQGTRSDVG